MRARGRARNRSSSRKRLANLCVNVIDNDRGGFALINGSFGFDFRYNDGLLLASFDKGGRINVISCSCMSFCTSEIESKQPANENKKKLSDVAPLSRHSLIRNENETNMRNRVSSF